VVCSVITCAIPPEGGLNYKVLLEGSAEARVPDPAAAAGRARRDPASTIRLPLARPKAAWHRVC